MTEKEMIEEIANILETRIVNKTWRSESVAREIYNAGYRKLDRDSVVLTLSEYMGFKKLEIEKFMSIREGLNTPINKITVKEEACWIYNEPFDPRGVGVYKCSKCGLSRRGDELHDIIFCPKCGVRIKNPDEKVVLVEEL